MRLFMTKFQLGLLVGCFLGALVMVVALGIIQLYLERRREQRDRVREQTAREIQTAMGARSYPNRDFLNHPSFPSMGEPGAEDDLTICYVSIRIE
jgi:hypothetical protein